MSMLPGKCFCCTWYIYIKDWDRSCLFPPYNYPELHSYTCILPDTLDDGLLVLCIVRVAGSFLVYIADPAFQNFRYNYSHFV